jgi:hypothetical protein
MRRTRNTIVLCEACDAEFGDVRLRVLSLEDGADLSIHLSYRTL